VLHNEVNGRSAFAAGKTFANVFGRRNVERRRAIVVKGTQSYEVDAPLAKRNEIGYYVHYLCGILYAGYGYLVYHFFRFAKLRIYVVNFAFCVK
jgi:hypothetical protein